MKIKNNTGRQYLYELSQGKEAVKLSTEIKKFNGESAKFAKDIVAYQKKSNPDYSIILHKFETLPMTASRVEKEGKENPYRMKNDYLIHHQIPSFVNNLFPDEAQQKDVLEYLKAKCFGPVGTNEDTFVKEADQFNATYASKHLLKFFEKVENKQFLSLTEKTTKEAKNKENKIQTLTEEMDKVKIPSVNILEQELGLILPKINGEDLESLIETISQQSLITGSPLFIALSNLKARKEASITTGDAAEPLNCPPINLLPIADESYSYWMSDSIRNPLKLLKEKLENYNAKYTDWLNNTREYSILKAKLEKLSPDMAEESTDASHCSIKSVEKPVSLEKPVCDVKEKAVVSPLPPLNDSETTKKTVPVEQIVKEAVVTAKTPNDPPSSVNSSEGKPAVVFPDDQPETVKRVPRDQKLGRKRFSFNLKLEHKFLFAQKYLDAISSFLSRVYSIITDGVNALKNWIVGCWKYFFNA